MGVSKLIEGEKYRVTHNLTCHGFEIGEVVRFVGGEDNDRFDKLDGPDFWFMERDEVEPVEPKFYGEGDYAGPEDDSTTSTFEEGEEWKPESYGTTFFESEDSATRKQYPIYSGVLKYFPDAIAAVSNCSWVGSKQHHPDEDMHWERDKSTDHEDCLLRHLLQKGTIDTDGVRHSTKVAWRALAILQLELEEDRKQ